MLTHMLVALDLLMGFAYGGYFPTTCTDIKTMTTSYASDGEYCLNIPEYGTSAVSAAQIHCHNIATQSPSEYITLPTGEGENYSKTYTPSHSRHGSPSRQYSIIY